MEERRIVYFDSPGKENTENVLMLAKKRFDEGDIDKVVVASATGETAVKALSFFSPKDMVVVTYHAGFDEPGSIEMKEENRRILEEKGIRILMASHILSGIERSLSSRFSGIYPVEIIAETLRSLFGHGLKTCVEISVMCCDAGLVSPFKDIIAIAGTGDGADTACVIKPANMNRFFSLRVKEIICMPKRK